MKILILNNISHQYCDSVKESECIDDLRNNISTDEIYPAKYCYYYKDIGIYALTGDRKGKINEKEIELQHVKVVIGGENFGCGSAREHAPVTLKEAGVTLIIAKSFNKTFRSNCVNIGLYTTSNFQLLTNLPDSNDEILLNILSEFSNTEQEILKKGGLFKYSKHSASDISRGLSREKRPQTIAEKIISSHILTDTKVYVSAGDEVLSPVDIRFSYEVFTPFMAEIMHENGYSPKDVVDPDTVYMFEDHFILSQNPQVKILLSSQKKFAKESKSNLHEYASEKSGICHTVLIENYIIPGQIVIGTDSHTGTGGVLGALCLPVGATDMANALITKKIFLKVPPTILVTFVGKPPQGVMAKDMMLTFFGSDLVRQKKTLGAVLEFSGEALEDLSLDELTVFSNMAIEGGAWTGIMHPTKKSIEYLVEQRGLNSGEISKRIVQPDVDAKYSDRIIIDASTIEPMIAIPSDPTHVVPLSKLGKKIQINKAFIGSCTGGKIEDLRRAAAILRNKKIAKHVQLVVHPSSMKTYFQARKEGIESIITEAGGQFLPSACGACIGQGPGRVESGETIISATNRNYRGRMGAGDTYLSNPEVVATSAIKGYISL